MRGGGDGGGWGVGGGGGTDLVTPHSVDDSVVERRTRDRKVSGSSPNRSSLKMFFSRVNFLCRLLFRYPFQPLRVCLTAAARKRSGHSAKSACGTLQLNTHASYVCSLNKVTL